MLDTLGRGFKRIGFTLGLAAGILIAIAVVVTVLPRTLIPFYLFAWILVLVALMAKHAEIPQVRRLARRPPYSSVLKVGEMFAVFLFGMIVFRTLLAGQLRPLLLAAAGLVVAFVDLME